MVSLAIILTKNDIFVSILINSNSKVWYIHSVHYFQTRVDHKNNINLVSFFPYENSFDTGSYYSIFRFFDMISYG